MEKKLVQVELPMFLFRKPDGSETLGSYDITQDNTQEYFINTTGVCMGRVVVIGEYETIEGDAVEKLVAGLEKAVEKERADSQVRVNALRERISSLKSLTHEAAE